MKTSFLLKVLPLVFLMLLVFFATDLQATVQATSSATENLQPVNIPVDSALGLLLIIGVFIAAKKIYESKDKLEVEGLV